MPIPAGLADLRFDALVEDRPTSILLSQYFAPCGGKRLLALRVGADWCGTCRWQAQHTGALDPFAPRLDLVDVVLADADNTPADATALVAYRKWIGGAAPRTLLADPDQRLVPFLPQNVALPATVLVDTRTLRVVDVVAETDIDLLVNRIARAFAQLDGTTPPDPPVPTLADGRFAKWQVEMMKDMLIEDAPPPDPSNAHADDPKAAALGTDLFFETGFSANQTISCNSCHVASKAYSDGLPTAMGIGPVDRNAPSITLASHERFAFWDGRADSLWAQATGPIEAANEMGSSRLRLAHFLFDQKKKAYEDVFGPMPDLSSTTRFPADGKPGDPQWEAMSAADKEAVDRIFSNAAKAIEAHERTLRVQPNALDRYVSGDLGALTDAQKDGLKFFFETGCAQCHHGPRLTDDAFHALRFPTGRIDGMPDRGRIDAIPTLMSNEFGRAGAFSDAPMSTKYVAKPTMLGAFKTPTLRGLPVTGPYGHGGTFATLGDVIAVYAEGGRPMDPKSVGTLEPWLPKFDPPTAAALVELMNALGGDPQN